MINLAVEEDLYNPIDTIEGIFSRDKVSYDRRKDNELVAEVQGKWDNMLIFFAYEEHLRCVHISCLLNIETSNVDRAKMFELLAMLNENLWLGHFAYWSEQKLIVDTFLWLVLKAWRSVPRSVEPRNWRSPQPHGYRRDRQRWACL